MCSVHGGMLRCRRSGPSLQTSLGAFLPAGGSGAQAGEARALLSAMRSSICGRFLCLRALLAVKQALQLLYSPSRLVRLR